MAGMFNELTDFTHGAPVITRCDLVGATPQATPVLVRRGVVGHVAAAAADTLNIQVRNQGRLMVLFCAHPAQVDRAPSA